MEVVGGVERRVELLRALAEPHRLRMVDALRLSDRSPSELAEISGAPSNLLAFHLDVLEQAGLVERHHSQGDARRRYVRLRRDALDEAQLSVRVSAERVLFVCTHNSARSQFAAAAWRSRTGRQADSAGTDPAPGVHPLAVEVARDWEVDLSGQRPRGYDEVGVEPDLVVSVCDRAWEAGVPWDAPSLHWSVDDPSRGARRDFRRAFDEIVRRLDDLALAAGSRP